MQFKCKKLLLPMQCLRLWQSLLWVQLSGHLHHCVCSGLRAKFLEGTFSRRQGSRHNKSPCPLPEVSPLINDWIQDPYDLRYYGYYTILNGRSRPTHKRICWGCY